MQAAGRGMGTAGRLSDGSVPEHGLLFGVGRRAVFLGSSVLFPAWQDGHAVLFAESLL